MIIDRGYLSFNLIENLNRHQGIYYVIHARLSGGCIKEIKELPVSECDCQIKCRVTTSSRYYIEHKDKEKVHRINHHWHQYKAIRSKNTENRRWDFGVFCTIRFRAYKFRIGTTRTGKPEWEVLK